MSLIYVQSDGVGNLFITVCTSSNSCSDKFTTDIRCCSNFSSVLFVFELCPVIVEDLVFLPACPTLEPSNDYTIRYSRLNLNLKSVQFPVETEQDIIVKLRFIRRIQTIDNEVSHLIIQLFGFRSTRPKFDIFMKRAKSNHAYSSSYSFHRFLLHDRSERMPYNLLTAHA